MGEPPSHAHNVTCSRLWPAGWRRSTNNPHDSANHHCQLENGMYGHCGNQCHWLNSRSGCLKSQHRHHQQLPAWPAGVREVDTAHSKCCGCKPGDACMPECHMKAGLCEHPASDYIGSSAGQSIVTTAGHVQSMIHAACARPLIVCCGVVAAHVATLLPHPTMWPQF